MSTQEVPRVRTAPGVHGCCDSAGRMAALAHRSIERPRLVQLALAHGEGTRAEIEQRITDMLAGGLLIEE